MMNGMMTSITLRTNNMKNLQKITEDLVVANLALRKAETFDELEAAQVDVDEAVTALCEVMGLDKGSIERFRLSDGRRRAA